MQPTISVLHGDVVSTPTDVLLLKHADGFYGADRAVSSRLIQANLCSEMQLSVPLGESIVIETHNTITPDRVLFLGVGQLHDFGYAEMERFARQAIDVLIQKKISPKRMTATIHGVGYGLDGEESLIRLVQGFRDGLQLPDAPKIREIVFVEADHRKAHLLTVALGKIPMPEPDLPQVKATSMDDRPPPKKLHEPSLTKSDSETKESPVILPPEKRHVFVAMPFSEDFEDVYEYGIYGPVRACGLICEKTSETAYTGDILARIKDRIQTADFVVAELSGGRPNVYLEVGYAWGKGVPVIFLARDGEQLHFDVTRHRCIYYKSIRQLAKDLEKLRRGLLENE